MREGTGKKRQQAKRRRKVTMIAVFAVLVIAIASLIFFYDEIFVSDEPTDEDSVSSENSARAPLEDNPEDRESAERETVFSTGYDPEPLPVDKPDYAQHSYSTISEGLADWLRLNTEQYHFDDETGEHILTETDGSYESRDFEEDGSILDLDSPAEVRDLIEQSVDEQVVWYASHFASRDTGFTNNPDELFSEDGSRNWDYSFVLAEDIEFFFGHNLERLINPVYGDWVDHQYPDSGLLNIAPLRPMFTEGWWIENIEEGDDSNLPIFADWNDDNYAAYIDDDVELISEGPRWVGNVDDYQFELVETFDGRSFALEVEMDLSYTSYTENSGTVELPASLDITLVPNYDNPDLQNYRLAISSAELSIDQDT